MIFKRLVNQGNHHFPFQPKVTTKWNIIEWKRSPKTRGFRLKREGWNLRQRPQLRTLVVWVCLRFSVLFKFGSPGFYHSLYGFVVSNDYAPMPPSLTDFSGVRSSSRSPWPGSREKLRKQDGQCFRLNSRQLQTWHELRILFHSRQHSTFDSGRAVV